MLSEDPPLELIQSIINLHNDRKFQLALSSTQKLVEQFPKSAITFNLAGAINAELSQFDQAIKYYKKAVGIRPSYYEAFYNMGVAQQSKNYFKEAIESYSKALVIKPNYADPFNNIGFIQHSQGNFKDAIESYSKAIEIKPDFAAAFNNIANSLIEIGDFESAADNLSEAIRIKPDYADAHSNIIKLLTFYTPKKEISNSFIQINNEIRKIKINNNISEAISNNTAINLFETTKKLINKNLKKLTYQETQIYRNNTTSLNCRRHMSVFKENDIIPKFCFSCFKVQVEPNSVIDLIKLFVVFDQLDLDENNTRKCYVELRPNISGFYKGLIYCNSIEQANNIAKYVDLIIKNRIGSDLLVTVKRGCSEYPLSFPEYQETNNNGSHVMKYNHDWKAIEQNYDKKNPHNLNESRRLSLRGLNISDVIIIQKWVDYAKGIQDPSAYLLNRDEVHHPEIYKKAKERVDIFIESI